MADYFALLDLPRMPWIDEAAVKLRFFELSGKVHPDRHHEKDTVAKSEATSRFKDINAAYNCLRDPKARLLHLIELETGRPPKEIQEIPHDTTKVFMEVGELCRKIDRHLKEHEPAPPPMLRVKLFERSLELTEMIKALLTNLGRWRHEILARVQEENPHWVGQHDASSSSENALAQALARLERLYRLLSYESRWTSQLQERLFQISNLI